MRQEMTYFKTKQYRYHFISYFYQMNVVDASLSMKAASVCPSMKAVMRSTHSAIALISTRVEKCTDKLVFSLCYSLTNSCWNGNYFRVFQFWKSIIFWKYISIYTWALPEISYRVENESFGLLCFGLYYQLTQRMEK